MPRLGMTQRAILVALLVCGAALLGGDTFLAGLCGWLDVGEAPACADHVFLLPGDETYRPVLAAAVLKAGLAEDVLIPETDVRADVVDGLHPPAAEVLSGVLRHRGILGKQIVCLEAASRTTFDDAHALSAFLERRPQDRVIVVTNAFHTRRARFVFQRVLGDNADRLQFVAAPNPGFADETWWQNRSSAHMVLAENLKLVFYVFRYSGPSGWVVSLLFIAIVWRWQTLRVAGRTAPRARSNPAGGPSQGEPAR